MVIFTPRPQLSVDILPLPLGVFEDDALLLRLAVRSRSTPLFCSRMCGPIDADDLAFEDARFVECAGWDF